MKSRTWVILFALLAAALLGVWLLMKPSGAVVAVLQDGKLLRTLDLSADESFTVTGPAGENRITVKNGAVFVESADCPDQVCVRHGALKPGGEPIVCLPNRLVIEWRNAESEVDGISGRSG